MSQHDLILEDQSRTNWALDAEDAVQALGSVMTGPVADLLTTYPNQLQADTTSGHMLKRNNAGDAWDYLFPLDQRIIASAAGTDTYVIALAPAINAYKDGCLYRFEADVANTGAATLNINGVAAWDIKKVARGALVALDSGDIYANQICLLYADVTASAFVLINPSTEGAKIDYSAISTIVGWASYTVKTLDYKKIGKLVHVWYEITGVSNSTGATFTLPDNLAAGSKAYGYALTQDNGAMSVGGYATLTPGSNVVVFVSSYAGGGFVASGNKTVGGYLCYEAA